MWDVVQRGLARFAREAEYRERRIFYQNNPQIKPEVPRVLIEEAMAKLPAPPKHKPVQASGLSAAPSRAFPDAATQFNPPKTQGQQNPAQGFPGGTVLKSAAEPFLGSRQSSAYEVPDPHFEVQEPKDKLHPLGLPDDAHKLAYNPEGFNPKASYGQQGYDVPHPFLRRCGWRFRGNGCISKNIPKVFENVCHGSDPKSVQVRYVNVIISMNREKVIGL